MCNQEKREIRIRLNTTIHPKLYKEIVNLANRKHWAFSFIIDQALRSLFETDEES